MARNARKFVTVAAGGATLATMMAMGSSSQAQVGKQVSFTKDVLPIFERRCQLCHGVEAKGGLKLDSFENLMIGGAKGPAIMKNSPANSILVQYIEGARQPRMPVGGAPLTRPEISTIRAWVQQGAHDDTSGPLVAPKATKPLEITEPKDGATVREKVRIVVPREGIPPEGFIAVYIDKKFRVALAPPDPEELAERKMKPDSPITYVWDTKAPLVEDKTAIAEDRIPKEGPHVVEIISYDSLGQETERAAAQVELRNQLEFVSNLPVDLAYRGREGTQYELSHKVDLEGTAVASAGGGPAKLSHHETTNYLVSLEDLVRTTGSGFWRQRRESPINITVNDLKQIVRIDTQSRYFSMDREGDVIRSRQMERERQEPVLNPITLPGRSHRMNETFQTNLRVNLGAYIPNVINVDRLEAVTEGIEWQFGEKCVRIRLQYLAGTSTLDLNSMNLPGCELEIESGVSTIWFSTDTQRVLKAEHEISGNMNAPISETTSSGLGAAGEGAPGGFGPSLMPGGMGLMPGGTGLMPGGPGMMSGPPGGLTGPPGGLGSPGLLGGPGRGAPGRTGIGGRPMGGLNTGAPFAGAPPGYPGLPGAAGGLRPGGMTGFPGMGGPGLMPGGPGLMPGGPGLMGGRGLMPGGPGLMPGGPGLMPGGPGMMGGGASPFGDIVTPTKRYHVSLKVKTEIVVPESGKKPAGAAVSRR